jgi:uncharacterized membrane protein YccC
MGRWLPTLSDPGLFGLRAAARAAIVMPAVFAFAHFAIGDPQTTLFAGFGSFAVLVFADFGGSRRQRLEAYGGLALLGAALIAFGTLCSRTTWAATVAMAAVGFAVLFAGVVNGWLAAGATAALLTFVLPVSLPADAAAIGPRLLGWGLAVGCGTAAQLLLWPRRPRDALRAKLGEACRALAALVQDGGAEQAAAATAAVRAAQRRFLVTPYRPAGPTTAAAATAFLVDETAWLEALLTDAAPTAAPLAAARDDALLRTAADGLRAAGAVLAEPGSRERIAALRTALARLDAGRERLAALLAERAAHARQAIGDGPPGEGELQRAVAAAFRLAAVTRSAADACRATLLAAGESPPRLAEAGRAAERLAADHASIRSVWFRNSVRGAVALAIAVLVAHETGVQEGFWVVLGTLSVLRSNALGTGATVLGALAGTALGIVVGAALVIVLGTSGPVLWICLPPAVLLAAYAPRAVSFAAGQAGFTLLLLILINLLRPVGWRVGIVRVEDVALGFGVSLVVGLLLWPRGAGALLRTTLAEAYARGADHVLAGLRALTAPTGATTRALAEAEREAETSGRLLDDSLRQYLSERGAMQLDVGDVTALAAGASRVRRTARALAVLTPAAGDAPLLEAGARALAADVRVLHDWYDGLGHALAAGQPAPALPPDGGSAQEHVLRCAVTAVAARDAHATGAALALMWASLHLDDLRRLERRLVGPARALAAR